MFFNRPAGHKYVNRGDVNHYDADEYTVTIDGNWHELDLSTVVPKGNIALLIQYKVETGTDNQYMKLRKKGYVNDYAAFVLMIETTTPRLRGHCIIKCDSDRKIEYSFTPQITNLGLTVNGWWI